MKLTLRILMLLLILSATFGCKKDADESSLTGTWEYRSSLGGWFPADPAKGKKGNGNTLKFLGDQFIESTDGKVTRTGTYMVGNENRLINNNIANGYIEFSDGAGKVFINLSRKKLILFYGSIAADGVEITYERIL